MRPISLTITDSELRNRVKEAYESFGIRVFRHSSAAIEETGCGASLWTDGYKTDAIVCDARGCSRATMLRGHYTMTEFAAILDAPNECRAKREE